MKIILGVLALSIAWLFVFRKKLIFAINDLMRRRVFSDQLALFQGRRVAALLTLLGIVALFSGIEGVIDVQAIRPNIAAEMLTQARRDLQLGHYTKVVNRCKELVRSDPKNIDAWELLATAWWAIGQKDRAAMAAQSILRLEPFHPIRKSAIGQYLDQKMPAHERAR
ncbi:MAG: hypothetical protein JO102_01965 [Elusimicrobia bacterium]|nr:hypothetical protein [Elusimicrobiota bacterium]